MPIPGTEPEAPTPAGTEHTEHPQRPEQSRSLTPTAPSAQEKPSADAEQQRERVCYVFAVGRAGGPNGHGATGGDLEAAAAGLCGPSGAPVRTVDGPGLSALVSDVPAGLYDESGLKAQLEDLERLEALARCHHSVVAAAYEHATVLPMRLATVYLDDSRVMAMLEQRQGEFDALLSRLEGHVEWGVKVYADPREAAVGSAPQPSGQSSAQPSDGAARTGGGPGRAYLRRRQQQRSTHRDTYRAAGAVAERVTALAGGIAAAKVAHRPQQGELAAGPGENIANDAYLVPEDRSEDFRAAISGLAEDVPGVRVELTGPWAPYSFATPPSAAREPQERQARQVQYAGTADDV
ncbi:GvpL/GvpF family gas vesicle protein [Streptomyces marispadix]|uniref:GvpL/GvpF family gas vesicle protein n=1 Tax=Streptomyces marispadix TaxID=2922868 RepID=A0ABS9STM2_9ACTN|nr:GvpL/GvpF family gas vesicle protein [Streptomyces marispadix]MCH6159411.1 GvpL/GvpF family gas vesicle protein [Streptomyces marispadix]